jgi:hypothetical protein
VHLDWMKPPSDLAVYYQTYGAISKLDKNAPAPVSNTTLKSILTMQDGNTTVNAGSVQLFNSTDAKTEQTVDIPLAQKFKQDSPAFSYVRLRDVSPKGEIFGWPRYFRLELDTPDFQKDAYPVLLTKQANLASTDDLKKLVLNPPYTPKLKTFMVSYAASFEIVLNAAPNHPDDHLFHIHPFGYSELENGTKEKPVEVSLLPDYSQENCTSESTICSKHAVCLSFSRWQKEAPIRILNVRKSTGAILPTMSGRNSHPGILSPMKPITC